MKILLASHAPWSNTLGVVKAQLEIKFCLEKKGHIVDLFNHKHYENRKKYQNELLKFIKEKGAKYDVIECHQWSLPFKRDQLNFDGLLVVRSVGLHIFYRDALLSLDIKNSKDENFKIKLKNKIKLFKNDIFKKNEDREWLKSILIADIINVPNSMEADYLSKVIGLKRKHITIQPFGVSKFYIEKFHDLNSTKYRTKKLSDNILFIGNYSLRKGFYDMETIFKKILKKNKNAHFTLAGTQVNKETIKKLLNLEYKYFTNIKSFNINQLEKILIDKKVAIFPSYIEGFGISIIEKLSAGIPVVAYEVSGPEEILKPLRKLLLVDVGDKNAFSNKVNFILKMEKNEYFELSQKCAEIAKKFQWDKIANKTLDFYKKNI